MEKHVKLFPNYVIRNILKDAVYSLKVTVLKVKQFRKQQCDFFAVYRNAKSREYFECYDLTGEVR